MLWRWLEFLLLFVVFPVVLYLLRADIAPLVLPVVCLLALYCCHYLWRKGVLASQWEEAKQTNLDRVVPVLLLFIPVFFLVMLFADKAEGISPYLWLVILLIYPLFSVLPQELIFRTFFFHRYRRLFPSGGQRIWISSACFGFAHLLYANWIAVLLSSAAGLLFGYRYLKSGSTAVVIIEHSLWGLLLFTTGLGSFFVATQTL